MESDLLIDASNLIVGRMASYVAKRALEGTRDVIVNAERAVISGSKANVVSEVKLRLRTRTLGSLKEGPTHPRRPDTYVRRIIRGMLPWDRPKGKIAYKRVRVYIGLPDAFKEKITVRVPKAEASGLRGSYVTVGDLSREIGGT